jgi:hypothetical protein
MYCISSIRRATESDARFPIQTDQLTTYNWSRMPMSQPTDRKKKPGKKPQAVKRRAQNQTAIKTEAIERLEKLATDLADVTAEASAVAEIVREGLAAEETNQSGAGAAKRGKRKFGAR